MRVSSEQADIVISSGDICFINSNVAHATETIESDTAHCLIQFSYSSIFSYGIKHLAYYLMPSSPSLHIFNQGDPNYMEILECILDMLEKNQIRNISNNHYIMSDIYKIFAVIFKENIIDSENYLKKINSLERLVPVLEYIDNHYGEDLTLDTLASQLCLNKEYFSRMFKKACGITIWEYLNYVRICKAEELFTTDKTITEISNEVGFSSHTYFNRVFKKYKHQSPTDFRKNQIRFK